MVFALGIHALHTSIYCRVTVQFATNAIVFLQLSVSYWNAMLSIICRKHFTSSSLVELFGNTESHKIIDFIKEINFYHLV